MATTTVYGGGAQIAQNDTDIATNVSDISALEAGVTVEVDTVGDLAAPNVLAASESRKVLVNEGTLGEENYHTLPTAAEGLVFTFICNHTDGIRATANTGDTIRLDGQISIAAGYVGSTTVGSSITLFAIDATEWIAITALGTWEVETS